MKELAWLFFRLGCTAFGGPAVHIAMMRQEVVVKRQWMTEQHFLDLLGATNLIPGPNSTEMAIHIGMERGGWRGLLIAGACFILPAVFITGIVAWLYQQYGSLPQVQPFLYGITPAVVVVVLAALLPMAQKSLKNPFMVVLGLLSLGAAIAGIREVYVMMGAGLLAYSRYRITARAASPPDTNQKRWLFPFLWLQLPTAAPAATAATVSNLSLLLTFLKIGSILYGSGYVLFAFLETEFVQTGLLTHRQLVDAIAVGQFTPGPVFSAVTFVGYQINGLSGAAVATLGIFLPAFVFVALLHWIMQRLRRSAAFSTFLDAVNVASLAVILSVCYTMMGDHWSNGRSWLIMSILIVIQSVWRGLNSAWLILAGAVGGYLLLLV